MPAGCDPRTRDYECGMWNANVGMLSRGGGLMRRSAHSFRISIPHSAFSEGSRIGLAGPVCYTVRPQGRVGSNPMPSAPSPRWGEGRGEGPAWGLPDGATARRPSVRQQWHGRETVPQREWPRSWSKPDGEREHHASLLTRGSGFKSWSGCLSNEEGRTFERAHVTYRWWL